MKNQFIDADLTAAVAALAQTRHRAEQSLRLAEERATRYAALPQEERWPDYDPLEVEAATRDVTFLRSLQEHVETACAEHRGS